MSTVGSETASDLDLLLRTIIIDVFIQTHAVSLPIPPFFIFYTQTPINQVFHTKTSYRNKVFGSRWQERGHTAPAPGR